MLTKMKEVKERFLANERIDKYVILLFGAIICVSLVLYYPYLTFSKLYVFNDIGSDTFDCYWPVYTYLMDWIREGNGLWSFNIGVGTSVLSLATLLFDPFNIFLLFSTKETLVYFLPYIVILKMICSGLLFFFYLKYIGISSKASFITSLMYTFNGYIVLWGQHYHFALLFILIPLVLWSYERLVCQNKWLMFTVSIGLTAVYSYYFFYMLSIFLFIYAITRYFAVEKFNFKKTSKLFLRVSGAYLLGVGLFMVLIAPTVYIALSNPRVSSSFTGMSLLSTASPLEYLTMASRIFSNDMIGMAFNFKGFYNYYEAPQLYSGLIVLLLIPQIFKLANRRKKISYIISGVILISILIFPFGVYFMNFFSHYKFRWTFIIIVYGLILCAQILNDVVSTKIFSKPLFISTFLGLMFILVIIGCKNLAMMHLNLDTKLYEAVGSIFPIFAVVCFLCFWFIYFLKYGNNPFGKRQLITLCMMLCLEMVVLNYFSVNLSRLTVSPDYVENKHGYLDYSNDVVNYIKENDKSFYRIDKSYFSRFLNDPLFQDYRGTTSYNSLNHPSYIKFLQETKTMDFSNRSTNYIYGLNGRPYLESLLGVKYYIGLSETDCPIGFSFVKQFGNVYLFKNNYVLPFGFTYSKYMEKKDFDKLQEYSANMTLLSAFVIEDESKIPDDFGNISELHNQSIPNADYKPVNFDAEIITYKNIEEISGGLSERFEYKSTTNDPMITIPLTQKISGGVMKVKFKITSSTPGVGQIFWADKDNVFTEAKSKVFNFEQSEEEYDIFIGNVSPSVIRIDLGTNPDMYISIENFEILYQDMNEYKRIISDLSAESLNLTSFSDSIVEGNINLSKNKLMFIPIPYDKGWSAYVDNQQVSLLEVNMGFSGLFLDKGYHNIKLVYVAPWLNVGIIVSIVSVLIVLLITANSWRKTM